MKFSSIGQVSSEKMFENIDGIIGILLAHTWDFCPGELNAEGSHHCLILTLCIRETPKLVILLTVKTQMKYSIMLHIIRVYTACKGKKEYNIFC